VRGGDSGGIRILHRRELIAERRFFAGQGGVKNRRATGNCAWGDRDFVDLARHGV